MRPFAWFILIIILAAIGGGVYWYLTATASTMPAGTAASSTPPVTFYCGAGNSIEATFASRSVKLALSDGTMLDLPQTISGSGIRYESTSTGADIVFASKGADATLTNSASTTDPRFNQCTAATVSAASAPGYDEYTDYGKTFTLTFPTDFSVAGTQMGYTNAWAQGATTTGLQLAKIMVPKSFEPSTNFGDAWLTVGVSSNPTAVAQCLQDTSGMPSASSSQVTINQVPFTTFTFQGAGAGNRYDTTAYHAIRDNMCYAVEYTIHYGVFENYPKGSVKRFDEQKVQSALDEIAKSFQFLP